MPDGSHLMALTSFCRAQTSLVSLISWRGGVGGGGTTTRQKEPFYRVSLEGLEGPVAAQATHVDAHVCAAGGEGGVVLPVHVQSWSCGMLAFVTHSPTHTHNTHNTQRKHRSQRGGTAPAGFT